MAVVWRPRSLFSCSDRLRLRGAEPGGARPRNRVCRALRPGASQRTSPMSCFSHGVPRAMQRQGGDRRPSPPAAGRTRASASAIGGGVTRCRGCRRACCPMRRRGTTRRAPARRGARGASCVMVLRPTGLSSSSPTVCRKNSPTSHSGLTRPSAVSIAAGTMSRNDERRGRTSPKRELHRARRLTLGPSRSPGEREQRRQHDDEQRVQRLEPRATETGSRRHSVRVS